MRPRGEIFRAALEAFAKLGRATWRQAYEFATREGIKTTANAWRRTIVNMARYGHLQPKDTLRVPGSRRPMRVYGLPVEPSVASIPLGQIMNIWGARP